MSKHTKGPWQVGGPNKFLNQLAIEPSIGVAYGAGAELVANANVMAAGPDLLEALEAVEWSYRYGGGDRCPRCCKFDHEGHTPDCLIGHAIKKARGEA